MYVWIYIYIYIYIYKLYKSIIFDQAIMPKSKKKQISLLFIWPFD